MSWCYFCFPPSVNVYNECTMPTMLSSRKSLGLTKSYANNLTMAQSVKERVRVEISAMECNFKSYKKTERHREK